jgi:hypothetical protein
VTVRLHAPAMTGVTAVVDLPPGILAADAAVEAPGGATTTPAGVGAVPAAGASAGAGRPSRG